MERMDPTISGSDSKGEMEAAPTEPQESVASVSSSSSDVLPAVEKATTPTEAAADDDAISSTTADRGVEADPDADLFASDCVLSDVREEKVVEDVEDIVQALENLLGGAEDSYFATPPAFKRTSVDAQEAKVAEVSSAGTSKEGNVDVVPVEDADAPPPLPEAPLPPAVEDCKAGDVVLECKQPAANEEEPQIESILPAAGERIECDDEQNQEVSQSDRSSLPGEEEQRTEHVESKKEDEVLRVNAGLVEETKEVAVKLEEARPDAGPIEAAAKNRDDVEDDRVECCKIEVEENGEEVQEAECVQEAATVENTQIPEEVPIVEDGGREKRSRTPEIPEQKPETNEVEEKRPDEDTKAEAIGDGQKVEKEMDAGDVTSREDEKEREEAVMDAQTECKGMMEEMAIREGEETAIPVAEAMAIVEPEETAIAPLEEMAIPAGEESGIPVIEEMAIPEAEEIANPEAKIAIPEAEIAIPEPEKIAVAEPEEMATPETEEIAIPVTEEIAISVTEEIAIPVTEQIAISESEKIAIPESEKIAIPESVKITIPESEKIAIPEPEETAISESDEIPIPGSDKIAIPGPEETPIPETEEIAIPEAEIAIPEPEKIAVAEPEEIAIPETEEITIPVTEEIAIPVNEEIAIPVTEEIAIPEPEKIAIPEPEETAIPETEEIPIPVTEEIAIPVTEEIAIPESDEIAIPEPEEKAIPEADEIAIPQPEETAIPEIEQSLANFEAEEMRDYTEAVTLPPAAISEQFDDYQHDADFNPSLDEAERALEEIAQSEANAIVEDHPNEAVAISFKSPKDNRDYNDPLAATCSVDTTQQHDTIETISHESFPRVEDVIDDVIAPVPSFSAADCRENSQTPLAATVESQEAATRDTNTAIAQVGNRADESPEGPDDVAKETDSMCALAPDYMSAQGETNEPNAVVASRNEATPSSEAIIQEDGNDEIAKQIREAVESIEEPYRGRGAFKLQEMQQEQQVEEPESYPGRDLLKKQVQEQPEPVKKAIKTPPTESVAAMTEADQMTTEGYIVSAIDEEGSMEASTSGENLQTTDVDYKQAPSPNVAHSTTEIDLSRESSPEDEAHVQPCRIAVKPLTVDVDSDCYVEEADTVAHPVSGRERSPLKITITKNKTDNEHSILKIYDPREEEHSIPKLKIRSTPHGGDIECITLTESITKDGTVPKLTIKTVTTSPDTHTKSKSADGASPRTHSKSLHAGGSPKITVKPVLRPDTVSPIKLTIKPVKPDSEATCKDDHPSPRITIKPVVKPVEGATPAPYSPRITIKPLVKPDSEEAEPQIPRIVIKPIKCPDEQTSEPTTTTHSPKITIKPVVKPVEDEVVVQATPTDAVHSPKITIKPVVKPHEEQAMELIDYDEQILQERIVLKIQKTRKDKDEERLDKIKVKLSKQKGVAHIISTRSTSMKRAREAEMEREQKMARTDGVVDVSSVAASMAATAVNYREESLSGDDVEIVGVAVTAATTTVAPPQQSDGDPLAEIPVFEIRASSEMEVVAAAAAAPPPPTPSVAPTPRKRGRPRKVPLVVREEFKDPKETSEPAPPPPTPPIIESKRPKRSCRGASVTVALGIKPRKPRGPGRGRGGKRNTMTREEEAKGKEPKLSAAKVKLLKQSLLKKNRRADVECGSSEAPPPPPRPDPKYLIVETGNSEVVMIEEETRMSADSSSRAHTPAKQVLSNCEVVEESQSSVQSTATESSDKAQKLKKGPRLEVHQEPEGEVISADKLAEYCWGGGGPYMLQEQVAQFLGIKSFKRKYPGIQRRPVDMQERDFIRESGLASEAMCDMGLTAVKSEDILDIMYTDFQHKYEEYCKHQRDRQAKEVCNKQKALSLAASQEKTKLDMVEQAVQSCLSWNNQFNKTRKESRRACMDLQTLTIHYPKGKMKQVNKPPVGNYPVAVVPGQFCDHYKTYTPEELGAMPLHTIGFKGITLPQEIEDSQSDGSGSESESSSSDSDSSSSDSSGVEGCKMCSRSSLPSGKKVGVH